MMKPAPTVPLRPPVLRPYRTPDGKFIPRAKPTVELYRLEHLRSEALVAATAELQQVLKLEDRNREALPEALLRMLRSVDPKAAYLAAQAFIAKNAPVGSQLEAGDRRYAFMVFTNSYQHAPGDYEIARVYEKEPGMEVIRACGAFKSYDTAAQIARKMNHAAGILDLDAALIVASSMCARK